MSFFQHCLLLKSSACFCILFQIPLCLEIGQALSFCPRIRCAACSFRCYLVIVYHLLVGQVPTAKVLTHVVLNGNQKIWFSNWAMSGIEDETIEYVFEDVISSQPSEFCFQFIWPANCNLEGPCLKFCVLAT